MEESTRLVGHGVLYLRAEPHKGGAAEQVSQQCLGSRVRVLREDGGWAYVEGDDTYRGWVDVRFLAPDTDEPLRTITSIFADVRESLSPDSRLVVRLPILAGVMVTGQEGDMLRVTLPGNESVAGYVAKSAFSPLPSIPADSIAAYAAERGRDLLGTPYLWGGSTPFGIDCSGFVQWAYRLAGTILRRDADIQRSDARFYEVPLDDPLPGDLILFGAGPDKITHIGMALADGTFIHSAGGAGVIVTPVGDDRYWPKRVDARRLDPARATDAVIRYESDER